MKVPIAISARHVHLAQKDLDILFGRGYQLQKSRTLKQPKEFAAQETVTLKGPKVQLDEVRIVGPIRQSTQVEISKTDAWRLGIEAPIRMSGDLGGSARMTIVGPKGQIEIPEGVIVPQRHIHCSSEQAREYQLEDNQTVAVIVEGLRKLVFHQVIVRVSDDYQWEMHLDTDEANAADLGKDGVGEVVVDED